MINSKTVFFYVWFLRRDLKTSTEEACLYKGRSFRSFGTATVKAPSPLSWSADLGDQIRCCLIFTSAVSFFVFFTPSVFFRYVRSHSADRGHLHLWHHHSHSARLRCVRQTQPAERIHSQGTQRQLHQCEALNFGLKDCLRLSQYECFSPLVQISFNVPS